MKMRVIFVGLLLGMCPVYGLDRKTQTNRQPLGVKACAEMCQQLTSCETYLFDASHLECDLIHKCYIGTPKGGNYLCGIIRNERKPLQDCPAGSRVIQSRKHISICIYLNEDLFAEYKSRLLAVPTGNYLSPTLQYFLHNDTVMPYTMISGNGHNALAYMASIQKIIFRKNMMEMNSYTMESKVYQVLQKNIVAYEIAVDDSKELIFAVAWIKKLYNGVYRMNVNGRQLRKLYNSTKVLFYITVDTKAEIFYAGWTERIITGSYSGGNIKSVAANRASLGGLSFDQQSNVLYYWDSQSIMIHYLSNSTTKPLMPLKDRPQSFLYYSNRIFVTFQNSQSKLMSVDVVSKKIHIITLSTSSNHTGSSYAICIIP